MAKAPVSMTAEEAEAARLAAEAKAAEKAAREAEQAQREADRAAREAAQAEAAAQREADRVAREAEKAAREADAQAEAERKAAEKAEREKAQAERIAAKEARNARVKPIDLAARQEDAIAAAKAAANDETKTHAERSAATVSLGLFLTGASSVEIADKAKRADELALEVDRLKAMLAEAAQRESNVRQRLGKAQSDLERALAEAAGQSGDLAAMMAQRDEAVAAHARASAAALTAQGEAERYRQAVAALDTAKITATIDSAVTQLRMAASAAAVEASGRIDQTLEQMRTAQKALSDHLTMRLGAEMADALGRLGDNGAAVGMRIEALLKEQASSIGKTLDAALEVIKPMLPPPE